MDLDEIDCTHWWRVCVAAGWISHPCLFSFAISTDAKRIEAESPRFLETWQSIMPFSALVLFDYSLLPMKPQPLVRGKVEWGGDGEVGVRRGVVGAGVMDIFV